MSTDRPPARAICQVTVDEQAPAASPETEALDDIITKLLPTLALPPLKALPSSDLWERYAHHNRWHGSD